jgi:hypothetical protein
MSSSRQPSRPKRKTYRRPVVRVYGTIRAITQAVGMTGLNDGGMGATMMTRP